MKMPDNLAATLLAPCGVTCLACYAHVRSKNSCSGCCSVGGGKPKHCAVCSIKACADTHHVAFCAECAEFPCTTIKRMDKRYREQYHVSLIENGRRRKAIGTEAFLLEEKARWTCECGGILSQHDQACSECGKAIKKG